MLRNLLRLPISKAIKSHLPNLSCLPHCVLPNILHSNHTGLISRCQAPPVLSHLQTFAWAGRSSWRPFSSHPEVQVLHILLCFVCTPTMLPRVQTLYELIVKVFFREDQERTVTTYLSLNSSEHSAQRWAFNTSIRDCDKSGMSEMWW